MRQPAVPPLESFDKSGKGDQVGASDPPVESSASLPPKTEKERHAERWAKLKDDPVRFADWKTYMREYRRKNRDHINELNRERIAAHPETRIKQNERARERHREQMQDPEFRRKWNQRSREASRKNGHIGGTRHRLKVRGLIMDLLGGRRCVNCGCDDIRALEFNHINGGGAKEFAPGKYNLDRLYKALLSGERKRDDLNVKCRGCNGIDHIERRFPDLKGRWKVTWSPSTEKVNKEADV